MATLNDVVEEVLLNLEGFSGDQAVIATLDAGIDGTVSTFAVDGAPFSDGLGLSSGLVEVGEELVYAQQFDRSTGTFAGVLRGWRGTSAVPHVAGEIVRSSPTFPRVSVRKAINDTIEQIDLFAVATHDFTVGVQGRYTLPTGVERVLDVAESTYGPSLVWRKLNHWSLVSEPGGSFDSSAKALDIPSCGYGQTVRVTYATKPSPLGSLSDQFTASGLEDRHRHIVVLGAAAKLVTWSDMSRLAGVGVDQSHNYQAQPPGQGSSAAKLLLAMYAQELAMARDQQQRDWPAQRYFSYRSVL